MVGGLGSGCSIGLVSLELALEGVLVGVERGGLRCGRTVWVQGDFFLEGFQGFIIRWCWRTAYRCWRVLSAHERR
jgi:hypothetical protein